jgi:hypothetical protein
MYDRRVARGSTVAPPVIAPSVAAEAAAAEKTDAVRKARKAAEAKLHADAEAAARALEVPPLPGRAHYEVRARLLLRRRCSGRSARCLRCPAPPRTFPPPIDSN